MSTDEITRSWRDPPQWGYVKENPDELFEINGQLRGGIEEGLTIETFERVREGYLCIICKEPHETPFPTKCSLCSFPMRDQQARYLQTLDRGKAVLGRDYGTSIDFDKELDRLDDEIERDEWADHPTLGIVIPQKIG